MPLELSFSDYFQGTIQYDKNENETISGYGNYYIHDATYSFHFQNQAIKIYSSSKVLIESCAFYNNSSTYNGGSINILQSDCILIHICCSFSAAGSETGGAYYIDNNGNSDQKIYAFESSVSQCSASTAAFYNIGSKIEISNMNTSYHNIANTGAFSIEYAEIRKSGIMNLTTVSNVTSSLWAAMSCYSLFKFTKCNYLNNECSGNTNSVIYSSQSGHYSNCSFIRNKANSMFREYPININNCYFKDNEVIKASYRGNGRIVIGEPLDSIISHYSTYHCVYVNNSDENQQISNTIPNTEGILPYKNHKFKYIRR
ncbi:hypothetical protein TVAG_219810 [Trichomonas vaginalis G3]|uniref:Right handed beta helix domain-containing protein n=1 Tax=Trichomonas vaginalis (strain ATCC PRA-98 / G3) TaxID=412133 RepID=A2DXT8_TRIV3|nr:hypothetical protein TVAGG3_0683800 [Trichomonas vaginalis G3]EAY14798.1 hypothetical protein TVAG_219810 [Trichomonas vaginalis G3]KAI5508073.1 hypothetical protein TVAGG3_0683800 [Trichomonas vaginalis G3]|eukprot:XP_001327021.1 hypothetical protein [Trichomonas vaginalis G3]